MTPRKDSPAALRRRVEKLEALLQAEKDAHAKTWAVHRDQLYELVDLRMRIERAQKALQGEDE